MILEGKNLRKTYGFDDNKVDAIKNLSIDLLPLLEEVVVVKVHCYMF